MAKKPPGVRSAGHRTMNSVLQYLTDHHQRLGLAAYGIGDQMASVLLTPRFRASSHVVFLILSAGDPQPRLVAKLPRLLDGADSLRREAANLQFARNLLSQRSNSIPLLVAFEEIREGEPILVETALAGRPMDPPLVRRSLHACCHAALRWLVDLQQNRPVDPACSADGFQRLVAGPLDYLAEAIPWSREERQRIERTREIVAPLADVMLPPVLEHGDFSHPNVMLLPDGQAGVVDWEMADPHGLPCHDLVFFLTYAAFARHQARENRQFIPAVQQAFFGEAAWAGPYLRDYADRLQLPPDALAPLFLLCWVRYLAGLLRRLDESTDRFGDDTADWVRQNRYYAAWSFAVEHMDQFCCLGATA